MAMGVVKEVKLYGSVFSGYCTMVHHALKLKGVAYEYVEENLQNKSQALLELNPVYKKVPVLVVDGKPIAESRVILEYVDEIWKDPPLLPEDPYERSKVRFWVDFVYQKVLPLQILLILPSFFPFLLHGVLCICMHLESLLFYPMNRCSIHHADIMAIGDRFDARG